MGKLNAFIVFGPSNSGTRYLTRLFLYNGAWGNRADHTDGFTQKLDDDIWPNIPRNIVWKTHNCMNVNHYPPDKKYGNISVYDIKQRCLAKDYTPILLMTYRDPRLNAKAQAKAGYPIPNKGFYEALISWYTWGWKAVNDFRREGLNVMVVNYDLMVKHPGLYTNEISNQLGIKLQAIPTIDANAKHWDPVL